MIPLKIWQKILSNYGKKIPPEFLRNWEISAVKSIEDEIIVLTDDAEMIENEWLKAPNQKLIGKQ